MEWINIVSSNIKAVSYEEKTKTLSVKFKNDSVYEYYDVPDDVYEGLCEADSPGGWFTTFIKNAYKYQRV